MNFNYNNNNKEEETYKALNEHLDSLLDQFEVNAKKFEEEYIKEYGYPKGYMFNDSTGRLTYTLDDHEKEMVRQLAEKMNCTWQYVMTEALDWYYMAVMDGVVEDDGGAEREEATKIEEDVDMVNRPAHYCAGEIETIEKIEKVIKGLPSEKAYCLGNVLKYFDRAGLKDDTEQDCDKANNYAYRLVYGEWREEVEDKRGKYIMIGGEDGIKIPFYK